MLNSVPIVGLKGDNVMYSQTKSSGVSGVEDVWSVFGRIPDGVNINSSKAVHFFPYKGDFCMSIGTAIYCKKHRDDKDPMIKMAVDNWPKLYLDAWEKIGDKCLPTANARNIIPFARMVGKDIRFHLVVLEQDGRLLTLNGDLAGSNNTFSELKNASYEKKTAARALKIQNVAYWNGKIVALDDANNTWNLDADFDARTFIAADQVAVEPLFEMTATDIGPVGVKKDGWIYRRRLENTVDPSDKSVDMKEKKIGWVRWMEQNGVTNLGVASPGVMLNLDALSRSLRDRYMSTQTSIYPVVNKIQAFTINHELFLKKQLEAAKEYQENEGSESKQKIAIKQAKNLVLQTKIWASIMRSHANHAKTSVNLMGEDLSSVKTQLDQQLTVLKDKLLSLQAQIKALSEAKAKMDAAFWGSIGVMLLGIGLAILGVATGVGVIALGVIGGALFVGGLVAACYFGSQSSKLAGQITDLESEMRGVNQAISDIKTIADKFGDLEKMYGTLNQFWGRMFNAAQNLKDMNQATALQIGENILEDTTSIEASIDVVRKMKNGCATYLAVLNKYGIRIDLDESDDEEDETADMVDTFNELIVDPTFKTVQLFNEQVARANQALENGQFAEYQKHLETAELIDVYTIQMGVSPETISEALNTASEQENAEAADLFDSLANLSRYNPLGQGILLIQELARDVEANDKPDEEPKESSDFLHLVADFARIDPVFRGLETIIQAANILSQDADTFKSLATNHTNDVNGTGGVNDTNGVNKEESADIIGIIANIVRKTSPRMPSGLLEGALSHDLDLDAAPGQAEPQETADIFSAIADFARSTPVGRGITAITDIVERASVTSPEAWFIKQIGVGLPPLANIAPFSSGHPSSGELNGILAKARLNVLEMLNKTLALAAVSESWMKQIPDVPATKQELDQCAVFQGQALLSCKMALEHAGLANNAFVDFNHHARDETERLIGEIVMLKDRILSVEARFRDEIEKAQALKVVDFTSFGISRISVEIKVKRLKTQMEEEIAQLCFQIARHTQELQAGDQFINDSGSWVEFCQLTSGNLGSIYNTLTSVKYGIKIDAVAYKNMIETQWTEIRTKAEDVKSLLQPREGVMDMVAMDLGDVDVASNMRPSSLLVEIALPATPLLQQLRAQVKNSAVVWDNISKLQKITYTEDMVGYLDNVSNRKVTLLDIINDIRGAYIQTAAIHYETVEQISTLALLQSTRANNLANGKISPHVFLKGTFTSVSTARKQAARVKALMASTSPELKIKIELVKASISEMKKAIANANLDLTRRDKAYRDKVTGIIVEGCLTGFATGGLVAAAAFAAYSGVAIASIPALLAAGGVVFSGRKDDDKPTGKAGGADGPNGHEKDETDDEDKEDDASSSGEAVEVAMDKKAASTTGKGRKDIPIRRRVEAAQDTWTALSSILRSAKDAASATTLGKALFNKMSLVELSMLVQLVNTAVIVMERTVDAMERLSTPLDDLLASVSGVADILSDMDVHCAQYQVQAGDASAQFNKRDAEVVKAQWAQVADACEAWLDIFNTQCISPLSYSVV
ncbi:hypothetical protein ACMFMG_003106 [Clarireedia jacksonii]